MTSDADNIVGLYQRHALAWAGDRGTRLYEASWLDQFRNLAPANATVLDIGCGSGDPIARYLIAHGCHLTGVDTAPDMIAMCQQKFPGQDWHLADMRALDLGRSFNGILAWDSFFHLSPENQRQMFPIFRKHAAPHAALMFTSGTSYGEAIGTFRGESLYHASLDSKEYSALLIHNGFTIMSHVVEDPNCEGRTVWLAQREAAAT